MKQAHYCHPYIAKIRVAVGRLGPGDAALRIVLRSDELTSELHPRFTTAATITIGCQLQSWQPRVPTAYTETAATSSQLRLVAIVTTVL